MVVPLATEELSLTHRELSKEAGFKFSVGRRRNITHKRSFKDHGGNVTLTHAGALDPAGDTASAHTHVCPGSPKPQSLQADRRVIQLQGRKGRNETSQRQGRNGTDWRKGTLKQQEGGYELIQIQAQERKVPSFPKCPKVLGA